MSFSRMLANAACIAALLWVPAAVFAAAPRHIALPSFFEPFGDKFVGRVPGSSVEISPGSLRLTSNGGAQALQMRWFRAAGGTLQGEQPTGGVSNYFPTSDEATWRTAIPHFAHVRVHELYPGLDVLYYVRDGRIEFDVEVQPDADPGQARIELPDGVRPVIDPAGDLTIDSGGLRLRFQRPHAYQLLNGVRREVGCNYLADDAGAIRFALSEYDHASPLVIDPIIDYMTYLGGSGIDEIHVIGVDAAGNVIAGGLTTSSNFPGAAQPLGAGLSLFITKLNAAGSAVIFTTILGTDPYGLSYFYPGSGGGSANSSDGLVSMVSDEGANTYAAGTFGPSNFPTTSGAWQRDAGGSFALKLNSSGQLVYSTMLGPPTFGLSARQIRVRDGIAYVAGAMSRSEFLGTAGALQRGLAGGSDLFALGLAPDGSHPTFLTAFGGTGKESLSDMELDASGNLILAGISSSTDLPLTSDALGASAPTAGASSAMLVRMDSTGSRLLYSTWLGTPVVNDVVVTPDGNYVLSGTPDLPAELTSIGTHNSIKLVVDGAPGYIAKFSSFTNRPLWTTSLRGLNYFLNSGMSSDGLGNLYWTDYSKAYSGGAIFSYGQIGPVKLSADGSALLYSSPFPSSSIVGIAGADGTFYVGGWTDKQDLPVSSGALQPSRDPAPAASGYSITDPLNYSDGFLARLDLGSFSRGNFFVIAPSFPNSITWRIGQPAPAALAIPVALSGDPGVLTATGSSRLTASFAATPSPAVAVSVVPTQTVAGTFPESVTLASQTNPEASLAIPVSLVVQPQVDFSLAASQITIEVRPGQTPTPAVVGVATSFGSEYFSFQVDSSNRSAIYGYVDCYSGTCQLKVQGIAQTPGTYNATLTVSIQGLANPKRTLQVTYILDPPAIIQLSSSSVQLHIVKGQPVQPVKIDVTGSVPGVGWTATLGVSRTWMSLTQSAPATPGQIVITADPAAAELGYWVFSGWATSESGQQSQFLVTVDVSSGAPIDVTPGSISTSYERGGAYLPPTTTISLTAATPKDFTLSADQPWIKSDTQSGTTPSRIYLTLDTTLPEGKYHGTVTVTSAGTTVQVPVDWEVYDIPKLAISTTALSFQYRIGDSAPAAQQIKVTCPTLHAAGFQIGHYNFPSPFSVNPLYGTTPVTLTISVNVQDLQPGTYQDKLSIQAEYGSTGSFIVPLTLTILPQASPSPAIASVVDAASRLQGVVSPGEVMSVAGSRFAPAGHKVTAPDPNGRYPVTVDGSTVYFDKLPAPVLYSSQSETLVVAPYGLAGRSTTSVTVVTAAGTSAPATMTVAATNPSLFTADSSGYGLASAQNVGSGGAATVHSRRNPAAPGTIVTVFATGLGVTSPALVDGVLVANPTPTLNASIQAVVGSATAEVVSYGPVAGSIAGLMRIAIRIPQGVPSGLAPVVILAAGNPSQTGVTLAIK